MLLTTCACCAAPLPTYGAGAKKCSRCKTRYCGQACQQQHWKEGGHDKLCRKIKKAGGAEQYHANIKYTEAVAVAVEKCAEDTKGQTCFICTQALHWKTKEGLVRGCSCRGTAGFAHMSCLAEQAKILVAEGEENNLDLNDGATLDNLREAVSTLEDTERTARRVLGSAHPTTERIERALRNAREILAARETPPPQA